MLQHYWARGRRPRGSQTKSGWGYKNVSKALRIPQGSIKSIIIKWKEHGTTTNLPIEGRPPRSCTKKEGINQRGNRETKGNPKLQNDTADAGVSANSTTISCTLHFMEEWWEKSHYLKLKIREPFEFAKKSCGRIPKCMVEGALVRWD